MMRESGDCKEIHISILLTLANVGQGGGNHYYLSENRVFYTMLYLSRFNRGGLTKFENSFFQIANLRFSIFADFQKNLQIFKKFSGDEFRSQGPHLLYSNHEYTHLNPCKTVCVKSIYKVDFRRGNDCPPPRYLKMKIPSVLGLSFKISQITL